MTLDDLAGKNYASTTQVAALWDDADPRTVRRMAEAGEIPSIRVGVKYMIPVSWLRQQMTGGASAAETSPSEPDLDQLADRVADRVLARFARMLGALAPDMTAAGPAPPEPAATVDDPPPATERSRAHPTPAA